MTMQEYEDLLARLTDILGASELEVRRKTMDLFKDLADEQDELEREMEELYEEELELERQMGTL